MSRVSELATLLEVDFDVADLVYIVDVSEVDPDNRSKKTTLGELLAYFGGGGTPLVADLEGGTFGANAVDKSFTFPQGLTLQSTLTILKEDLAFDQAFDIVDWRAITTDLDEGNFKLSYSPSNGITPSVGGAVTLYVECNGQFLEVEVQGIDTNGDSQVVFNSSNDAFEFRKRIRSYDSLEVGGSAHPAWYVTTLVIGTDTGTTIGAAGGASALPATPLGYFMWYLGNTPIRVPYYSAP